MTAFPLATRATKDRRRERLRRSAWHKNLARGRELSASGGTQAEPGRHRLVQQGWAAGVGSSWVGGVEGLPYFMIVQVYLLETGTAHVKLCLCTSSKCFLLKLHRTWNQDHTCRKPTPQAPQAWGPGLPGQGWGERTEPPLTIEAGTLHWSQFGGEPERVHAICFQGQKEIRLQGFLEVFGFGRDGGQHGQEVRQRQEAPAFEQLPLPGAAQRDREMVLPGPVHVVAVRTDLLLESAVLGWVLGLRSKDSPWASVGAPPGLGDQQRQLDDQSQASRRPRHWLTAPTISQGCVPVYTAWRCIKLIYKHIYI